MISISALKLVDSVLLEQVSGTVEKTKVFYFEGKRMINDGDHIV